VFCKTEHLIRITNDEIQQDGCSCAGDYIPCSTTLNVLIQQPDYNDNGTVSDSSDDTFTIELTISGNGNGWIANGQAGAIWSNCNIRTLHR
jgi:hypothetical protein